jgi:hypothetical protein
MAQQEVTMKKTWNADDRSQLSPKQRAARELAKRIRKLRWLGEEENARLLQAALAQMPPGESVLLLPMSTD